MAFLGLMGRGSGIGNCTYAYLLILERESIPIFVEQALWVNAGVLVYYSNCNDTFATCEFYFAGRAAFHAIASWVNFVEVNLLILF